MKPPLITPLSLSRFRLWEKLKGRRAPISFELEVTARCNNNCRHCYINLPAADGEARARELSREEILAIAREAVQLGAVWCLLTGGEPLLRDDFIDLYLGLRRLGLLISVFTNACLVTREHAALFAEHPPRDVEVTVYGVTEQTYEGVTRRPGSFAAFRRGIGLLRESGVRVRLKAMALRANAHELAEIARFSREHSKGIFRFDPFLHLRYDGDPRRNEEICGQRLSPEEIVALERADPERWPALRKVCDGLAYSEADGNECHHLFRCGAGLVSFAISYDGHFKLCPSLRHPDCMVDLRQTRLREAWEQFVPRVRAMTSQNREFLEKCQSCGVFNLCFWCPASASLETGRLDAWVEYFCRLAQARARGLGYGGPSRPPISLD